MANELTKRKIAEVAAAMEAAGLERLPARANDPWRVRLTMPSRRVETYLGTFLNPFSVGDAVRLWSDEYAVEYPEIAVGAVYRHNGAAEDVSVEVTGAAWHTSVAPFPSKYDHYRKNPEFVRIVAEEAPVNYLDEIKPVSAYGSARRIRLAKLRNTAKAKAVSGAVAKALAFCEAFVPRDHSAFAQDRSRFHADTTAECAKPAAEKEDRRNGAETGLE